MDFSVIFQLRTKKFWWMDVIFYFVISLLIATLFCYGIFLVKDGMIKKQINDKNAQLLTVGTNQQREEEKSVIEYQGKIMDFSNLLKNHEFASNAFAFLQLETMPNVWFKQISLDEKNGAVQLSGESDSMDAFSRQVVNFEKNKYVRGIGTLNSSIGGSTRIDFNMNLMLDQNIFNYLSTLSLATAAAAVPGQVPAPAPAPTPAGADNAPPASVTKSSEKLITSFHFLLQPEVEGSVDETNYTVALNVPYGTDVKNLIPSMVISPEATVSPDSGVSKDFTSPVIYTVTAQDGSTQSYTASVIISAQPVINKKPNQSWLIALILVALIVGVVILAAIIFLIRKRKLENKN